MIKIIGLGAGNLEQLPLGVYKALKSAEKIYVRTIQHPVVTDLRAEGMQFISFDDVYEKHEHFEQVYAEIVATLINQSLTEHVVYAVPGHPMVAEKTVQLLLESSVNVEIIGGQSFLDAMFIAVQIDPVNGFQLLDGTALKRYEIQITQHVIITQVYDAFVASDVKLTLMEKYPEDHIVVIVKNAGMSNQIVQRLPLYELDHGLELNNLMSIYVPPTNEVNREFWKLREIFDILRGPNGCPWDKKQTHESLTKNMLEEAAEYVQAVQNNDLENMIEELGDVLLQIMLNSKIGEEDGYFSIDDVIEGITNKMIRRHPHVFSGQKVDTPEEALILFQQAKRAEKDGKK
ncbi:MAG: yabN [Bacillales bacterium]|jgi:tetrapyrrole methylase family protein/MazG family protein|nr:yabN [Bacillales bacterium]